VSDILSQNEIDELLNALNTGEINVSEIQNKSQEKKVRLHDFRRPSKFAKDHLKTLNIIYDNYARLVTNFLTGYLRTVVQIDVVSVETLAYNDFSNSILNPVIISVVDFTPLTGSIIIEIAPNISYALVDRILGGKGYSMDKVRDFTEIEIAILERVITQMLNIMREPWENILAVRPRLERIETNVQFAQIISPNEMVALITLDVTIGEAEGMINICMPYMVLEPIMPKLSTKFWFASIEKGATEETKELIANKIKTTLIPIKACLGKTSITIKEFLELQAGDVLQLDTNVNGDMEVYVGEILKFLAKPGVRRNKIALKITEIIKKEDE
jgi:flagellar motor switch protein FliM